MRPTGRLGLTVPFARRRHPLWSYKGSVCFIALVRFEVRHEDFTL